MIGHGDQGLVAALDVIDRAVVEVRVRDALVLRDLEVVAVKLALAAVHLHVFVRHVKGLMRVKSLDHQEEIVLALVVLHPVACGLEGLGTGHVFLARPLLAILLILLAHAAVKGLRHVIGLVDAAHPRVALLPAIVIPRVELLQVALATGAQIVAVVGSDVAKGAGRAQALGQRHVKGLDGAPGALEKVVSAAHDVATSRHAGGGANPVVVEHARALRKPVQVGHLHLSLGVVAREHVATQRVHQHQYRSHDSPFQHIRWSTRLFFGRGPRPDRAPWHTARHQGKKVSAQDNTTCLGARRTRCPEPKKARPQGGKRALKVGRFGIVAEKGIKRRS